MANATPVALCDVIGRSLPCDIFVRVHNRYIASTYQRPSFPYLKPIQIVLTPSRDRTIFMNNPFDYIPDAECEVAFRVLVSKLEALTTSDCRDDREFSRELQAGKMLGVLIAEDARGERHTLYAFSGQSGERGFYRDGFVGPVFDYLAPDGYFKTKEAEISGQCKK